MKDAIFLCALLPAMLYLAFFIGKKWEYCTKENRIFINIKKIINKIATKPLIGLRLARTSVREKITINYPASPTPSESAS